MNYVEVIIKRRSIPGVLILEADYRLLYANSTALEIAPSLRNRTAVDMEMPPHIPDQIVSLCDRLKISDQNPDSVQGHALGTEIFDPTTLSPCSVRAFFIGNPVEGEYPRHIMVLMERIVERHEIDFAKAKSEYGLTKREVEVLQCVCCGLTNGEIAEAKFISEYTVKDHLKKIMRSMGIHSRSEIIATLR
jgi:DNA-binding CsgD family transcriptional regulator